MYEFWSFIRDVTRDIWNTRAAKVFKIILIVIGVLALLYFALPLIAGIYMLLFITSWNASVAELFSLPLMNLGQANALCFLSVLTVVPLFFVAALFRSITNK